MTKSPSFRWLLFDLDNTLIDFNEASHRAFFDLCNEINIAATEDHYRIYRSGNEQVWKEYEQKEITAVELRSKRFQLFFDHIDHAENAFEANAFYLERIVEHTKIIDNSLTHLQEWKADFKLAIITNGLREVQRPRLRKTGLYDLFDSIVVSDEISLAKPQVEYFQYAFDSMGESVAKEDALVVGDSILSDIKGARDFGCPCVWYNPKDNTPHHGYEPTYSVKQLVELNNIIYK